MTLTDRRAADTDRLDYLDVRDQAVAFMTRPGQ